MLHDRKIQINRRRPTIEPMTMPAMAPPERVCVEVARSSSLLASPLPFPLVLPGTAVTVTVVCRWMSEAGVRKVRVGSMARVRRFSREESAAAARGWLMGAIFGWGCGELDADDGGWGDCMADADPAGTQRWMGTLDLYRCTGVNVSSGTVTTLYMMVGEWYGKGIA